MKPRARITHTLPGRLRLKVPEMRGRIDFFERVHAFLERQEEIESVLINPITGSVLITSADPADLQALALRGEEAGLYSLGGLSAPVASTARRAQIDLRKLDIHWSRASGGATDSRSLLVALLLIAGLVQIARGQVFGPGAALLITAYQLIDIQPDTSGE